MSLVNELIKGLLPEEEKKQTTAVYAGGFKPPTSGHFEVVQQALKENPEIDEFIIFVGAKPRDGVSQTESLLIWEIYNNYLPFKVKIVPTSKPPIRAVYNFAKEHPTREVLWVIGAREGNEEDFKDITSRTSSITKYPNLELRTIVTTGGVSGTAARNAAKVSLDKFSKFVPDQLTDEEKKEVFDLVSSTIQENYVLQDLENQYGIDLDLYDNGKHLTLSRISIPKDKRGQGIGSKVMNQITQYADKENKPIYLTPTKDFGASSVSRLEQFYKQFGFKKKDRSDFSTKETMVRIPLNEADPKKGTGKKPKGSGRRLYTDEDPKDTVGVKFSTRQDIVDTLNKKSFKAKSHARQSQIINLIHQRTRAAYNRAKKPDVKKRLKTALDYITKRKEASKKKTQRLKKQKLKENASYSQHIDIWDKIDQLNTHMINKGMNIEPLPTVELANGDVENAKEFLGKTAYYDPNKKHIVLYTEGRHPKDIVRSYAHEMIHHIQNLEGRLGNIQTTNTHEDDNLNKIEAEANLKGTMTFRNWTDSLNENVLPQEKFAQETGQEYIKQALNNIPQRNKYSIKDYKVVILPLDKVKPTQFGEDYINASSEYEAEQYKKYLEGKIKAEDLRKEDFYPIIVDKDTMEIIDGNHRHAVHIMLGIPKIKAILVSKNKIEEKTKDPFGLNAYAMELGRLREEKTDYTIYCDMDGVLADFERGYKELTGIDLQGEFKPEGEEFWNPIQKAGVGYWAGLKWMPDGQKLWDYIKPHTPKLLSAPSKDKSSRIGKHVWVKHKLPGTKLILRYASQKQELAEPNAILIDDREKNIEQWEAAGGIGILHTSAENTIKQLQKLGL